MTERENQTTVPTAIWSGSFQLLGIEVKCHTLSDGRRIIEADSMRKLLESMASKPVIEHEFEEFAKWQRG